MTGFHFGRILRALAGTTVAAAVLLASQGPMSDARAAGFQDDVGGKTELYLKDIPALGSLLSRLGLGRLANTKMVSVTSTPDTISGYVNFLAFRWNLLVFKNKTESYFALEPVKADGTPMAPKLSDFLNVPGIKLTDMLTYDRVVWVVAAKTIELKQTELPAPAKKMFAPYFGNVTLPVDLTQGLTFFGAADLGKAKPLRDALQAIGGKSTNLLFKAQLEASVLGSLIKGEKPSITAKFRASLPPIQPVIGGKVKLPQMTLGLLAELEPVEGNVKFGFVGEAAGIPFFYPDIVKRNPKAMARTTQELEVAMALEGGKPVFSISSTIFKGEDGAFKKAFGLPFLDLQDYTAVFEIKADAVSIGIGAGGRFYDKNITVFAAVQVPAQTSGIPIPDEIKFMVEPTNPNAIASLSLRDLTNAFADLTNAVSGSRIPKPPLPENFVRIAGINKGEGPFVDINLNFGLDAGLEMAGKLDVFGTEMGVVETAVLKPTQGIAIKAHTNVNLPLGSVIKLPQGDVDIDITPQNITDPHVRIRAQTVQLLGSGGAFEISIDKRKQVGIVEGAVPFNLFAASLVLESNTQSVKNAGFSATGIIEGDFFSKFADGVQTATADIAKGVESAVSGMNNEIHVFTGRLNQTRIDKEKAVDDLEIARRSAYREFDKALAEVDRLEGKYKREKDKCGPEPWKWDHCVAAGSLWTALKVGRGVLKVAQKVVDEFLKGTGKVLAAVVDGLNKSIQVFSKTIEVAGNALGTAAATFGKTLEVAGRFAGQALSAVADVFDIEKMWMKGKLAVLQLSQAGALGVEYTLLGKQYLKDVSWDFKVPIDKVFDVFKPGSSGNSVPANRPPSNQNSIAGTPPGLLADTAGLPGSGAPAPVTVAGKFSYNPVTTAQARGFAESMIEAGEIKALTTPFNPEICTTHPYALEEQIKTVADEYTSVARRQRNAEIGKWISAMESSAAFRDTLQNPVAGFRWVASGRGKALPRGAYKGGSEPGRNLYVCRANYKGNWAAGKVVAGYCNIGFSGKEHKMSSYDVLVAPDTRVAKWVYSSKKAQGTVYVGKEKGKNVYVCRAKYKGGTHPGKIAPNGNCYIGYGGKERRFTSKFEALQTDARYSHNFTALNTAYRNAKTSFNQRDSSAKYAAQAKLLAQLDTELKRAPTTIGPRRQIEQNLRSYKPAQQLDPAFLSDQAKRLAALHKELLALRRDPASPCGVVAKEMGVKPKPAAKAQVFALDARTMLAQSAMAKAVSDAAMTLAKRQQAAQTKQRAAEKRKRLIAFTNRIKLYEAQMKKHVARIARRDKVAADIPTLPRKFTAAQRNRRMAMAKLARTQIQNAKVVAKAAKRRTTTTRNRRRAARADLAGLNARTLLPAHTRVAFARAFDREDAQMAARAAANLRRQAAAQTARIAKHQAAMAARLARMQGMSAAQKKALSEAYARAAIEARGDIVKAMPVAKQSNLAGRETATGAAKTASSGVTQDVVGVKASYRSNLRKLGIPVR